MKSENKTHLQGLHFFIKQEEVRNLAYTYEREEYRTTAATSRHNTTTQGNNKVVQTTNTNDRMGHQTAATPKQRREKIAEE